MVAHAPQSEESRAAWRRRSRRVGGALLVLVGLGAMLSAWVYAQAGPGACRAVRRSDLSLEQMGSVKRRLDSLEANPDSALALTGEELTFLLADNLAYPVSVAVDGDTVSAQLALQEVGTARCYHVDFRGGLSVEGGVATLRPTRLAIGDLDLGPWLAGRPLRLKPSRFPGAEAGHLLSQVRRLEVAGGQLEIEIDDVASLNPRRAASNAPSIRAGR